MYVHVYMHICLNFGPKDFFFLKKDTLYQWDCANRSCATDSPSLLSLYPPVLPTQTCSYTPHPYKD